LTAKPTSELAEFFSALTYDDIPRDVRDYVKDIILDTFASAIAGRRGDETLQIQALAEAIGGEPTATVLAGPRQSLAGAALLNGYQVTAVTVCDIHRPTLCHVTPEVIPPALAIAEDRRLSGKAFLVAVAAGLEAVVRVGAGMRYPKMRARGWHSPGVIGPFGGATAVASLMGLDPTRFRNALSLAGTQSAGTFAHWGTPTIKFHQSRGSYSGLLAALLAETGFKAGPEVLTAEHGGLFNLYSDGGDPDSAVAGLGSDWTLKTISLRLWPAASSIQTVITGLFALIEAHDVRPEDIEKVEIGLSKTVYDMHGTLPWDNKFRALLSTPYVTGVVLHDRKCWFEQFTPERISNPDLDAFIKSRVSVAIDDAVEGTGAAVTIRTKDGRTLEDRRAHPRGDAADPLNRAEIKEKFRQSAQDLVDPDATAQAIALLEQLEDLDDMSRLTGLLGQPGQAAA
jgi:2-methylcitrate dehydratase PrpD